MASPAQHRAHLVLANDHAGLDRLGEWLEQFTRLCGLPAAAAFRLDLVLTEAVTNVMDYAKPADRPGRIDLTCSLDDGRVEIELADDGPGFDPTARAPVALPGSLAEAEPGGLGIHLMRRYTTRIEYRRADGRNILSMTMPIDHGPGTG